MLEGQNFTLADAANPPGRLAQFMRMMETLNANEIGTAVELMIAQLDAADGDPDNEEPGLEDSFCLHTPDGPGCPVADVGDPAWIEWDSRGRHKLASLARDAIGQALHEDAEDDDPAEESDSDRCAAGDDHMTSGPVAGREWWDQYTRREPGDAADHELSESPAYQMNQSLPLTLRAANDGAGYAA